LYLALRSVEQLGLKLNVRSDSVLSFVHQNSAPDFGTMRLHSINPIQFSAHEFSKHVGEGHARRSGQEIATHHRCASLRSQKKVPEVEANKPAFARWRIIS
jgi:hypothetical protein